MTNQLLEQLLNTWTETLLTKSTESMLSLYHNDAILLPTLSNKVCTNHTEIADYFDHFLSKGPRCELLDNYARDYDSIGTNSGTYRFTTASGDSLSARYTFVYSLSPESNMIIEHHSSLLPI